MLLLLKILLFIDAIVLSGSVLFQKGEESGLGSITGTSEELFGDKRKGYIDKTLMRTTIITSVVMCTLTIAILIITAKA